jgi:hypothetical protein
MEKGTISRHKMKLFHASAFPSWHRKRMRRLCQ